MTIFLFIVATIFLVALVFVASLAPHRSRYSSFELERRKSSGSAAIGIDERREAAYGDIVSAQRVLVAILLVGFVLSIVGSLGWLTGGVIAVLVSLEYGMLSGISPIRRLSAKVYDTYESMLLEQAIKHKQILSWFRSVVPVMDRRPVESREELEHLVKDTQGILNDDEKKLIAASLKFDGRQVQEIMTPRSVVDTVGKDEMLGPLVLDDLHKTGHSRFPVIDGDMDHVVGILYVHDVLTLDTTKKHTSKVESAMSGRVYYIREDHTLAQALSAFLRIHHHMFVVINEYRETVGIVTLEDTLEALLGRKIVDEFDAHDDMRAVAERKAASKNALNISPDSKDI